MGHWILLKGPAGERKVMEGIPYRRLPGEVIAGTQLDDAVPAYANVDPAAALVAEIEGELGTEGKGIGDWAKRLLKPVALLLGKQNCLSCEARRLVLNAVTKLTEKHGQVEAKRIIKDLLARSLKAPPSEILQSLKDVL
jgi:hypothetical protein